MNKCNEKQELPNQGICVEHLAYINHIQQTKYLDLLFQSRRFS